MLLPEGDKRHVNRTRIRVCVDAALWETGSARDREKAFYVCFAVDAVGPLSVLRHPGRQYFSAADRANAAGKVTVDQNAGIYAVTASLNGVVS